MATRNQQPNPRHSGYDNDQSIYKLKILELERAQRDANLSYIYTIHLIATWSWPLDHWRYHDRMHGAKDSPRTGSLRNHVLIQRVVGKWRNVKLDEICS